MMTRLAVSILCGWLTLATAVSATTPAATVRFATACALCHEGECSGRLSFARRPEAAFDHIRQYAGPVEDELARQMYDTLEQMKSDCRYPALAEPELQHTLNADALAGYRDPWSGDYFLPLGDLPAGDYRLMMEFDEGDAHGGRLRVELIDAGFDPLIDQCLSVEDGRLDVTLTLGDTRPHFLRLRPRAAMRVTRLKLVPIE